MNDASDEGSTALMEAASQGSVDLVRMLLERGADMERANNQRQSAWIIHRYSFAASVGGASSQDAPGLSAAAVYVGAVVGLVFLAKR